MIALLKQSVNRTKVGFRPQPVSAGIFASIVAGQTFLGYSQLVHRLQRDRAGATTQFRMNTVCWSPDPQS
jgi:hypothetical protein